MAIKPYRITHTDSPRGLTEQLARVLAQQTQDVSALSKRIAALEQGGGSAATPASGGDVASLQAEVASLRQSIRPMEIQGSQVAGGSILTQHLGIGAPTGAPEWAASTSISAGQQIRPTGSPADGKYFFTAANSGTTGATEPTWSIDDGATTDDNTIVWKQSGLAATNPPGDSSFLNQQISAVTLPSGSWVVLTTASLYMGDVDGRITATVFLYDTTFSAGNTINLDFHIVLPGVAGGFDIAKWVTFGRSYVSVLPTTYSTLLGNSVLFSKGTATPVPGDITITVTAKQTTGSTQTINAGSIYLSVQHS